MNNETPTEPQNAAAEFSTVVFPSQSPTTEGEQLRAIGETMRAVTPGAELLCSRIHGIADRFDFACSRNEALWRDLVETRKRANRNAADLEGLERQLCNKDREIEELKNEIESIRKRAGADSLFPTRLAPSTPSSTPVNPGSEGPYDPVFTS